MALFESVEERAARQALELAADLQLPVAARSLPADQVRGKGCVLGLIVLLLALVAVAVFAALLVGAGTEEEPRRTIIIVAVLAFAALIASSLIKGWRSRRSDYIDPELTVEAGAEGVTIAGPARRHLLNYSRIRVEISSIAVRHSVRFVGVKLESPLGPIELNDALFANGRNAAAAIVRGMREER